jgi:hypothetical protein
MTFQIRKPLALAVAALVVAGPGMGLAGDSGSDREIILTGYLFASALDGRSSLTPGLPAADIDLSFGDVLENLDFGLMTAVELRQGRWSFVGDVLYSKLSPGGTLPGPAAAPVDLEQKNLTLQGSVLYRVQDSATVNVDLGAGLRYWSVDSEASIGPVGPASASLAHKESWLDPVVIARMKAELDESWSVTVAGDLGGSGSGATLTWQLLGTVNYQMSDRLSLRGGYRVLSVDYEDDGYVYDVVMRGPVLGLAYRF